MEKEWYVVNTYSGHESKVKEKLEMRPESMGMQDYIFRIVIPKLNLIKSISNYIFSRSITKIFTYS